MKRFLSLVVLAAVLVACSGDDRADTQEVAPIERTFALFSPASNVLPIPNDLLFSAEPNADGTMFAGSDTTNPVIRGIDALDGASLISPIDIAFSDSLSTTQVLDARSFIEVGSGIIPNPSQNVFLLPLVYPSGDSLVQARADTNGDGETTNIEVPSFANALKYQQAIAIQNTATSATLAELAVPAVRADVISLDGGINNVLRIMPLKPLSPKTKYLVVITTLDDTRGNRVLPSIAYETIRNPENNLAQINPRLAPLQPAVMGWEQLASGYFGFMQQVFDQVGVSEAAPLPSDIIFSLTLTTTASSDVLVSMVAPETFFERSLEASIKKTAITKLALGQYDLTGNAGELGANDAAINQRLNILLTASTVSGTPNPLFSGGIAAAINAGSRYGDFAANPAALFVIQTAAAQAALHVENIEPNIAISQRAREQVTVMAQAAQTEVTSLFAIPTVQPTQFYRQDRAQSLNPALTAPAMVMQGQITLPVYRSVPSAPYEVSDAPIWQADTMIGGLLDAARGNVAGTTPVTSKITYRYPFAGAIDTITVPILATLPDEALLERLGQPRPENGWPVVIFTHSIRADRSVSLPLANALAAACIDQSTTPPILIDGAQCYATVAIDMPTHGVAPKGSEVAGLSSVTHPTIDVVPNLPSGAAPVAPSTVLRERHYDLTFDGAAQAIPMDYASGFGDSGSLFINLTRFTHTRDNLRQAVMDLLHLNASLNSMDVNADGVTDFDTEQAFFIGHALGAMVGTTFVAVNNQLQAGAFNQQPKIQAASFLFGGGGISRLLTNSRQFSSQILGGLASASDALQFGRSGLETYLNIYQGVLDSADPIQFASLLTDKNSDTGVLVGMIAGDQNVHPSDTVIPNGADVQFGEQNAPLNTTLPSGFSVGNYPAPFSGTEPFIKALNATLSSAPISDGDPAVVVTRFTAGDNRTPLGVDDKTVFNELVNQLTVFFNSKGTVTQSIVTDSSVVQ